MIGPDGPYETTVVARVGEQPHFPGTIHDDGRARVFGYRAALVPGISLYAFMSSLAVEAWGLTWLRRGSMQSNSRRPVYDGEVLTIAAEPVVRDAAGLRVAMAMRNRDGAEVATGAATLPDTDATPPTLAAFPVQPLPEVAPPVAAGELLPGTRFGCEPVLITPELHRESLAYFQQHWPGYAEHGAVHPAHLQRVVTRNSNRSMALPTPSIFVEGRAQHFAVARVGDTLTTAGTVTATYERRGNHYYDSESLVLANGASPIALVHRTAIYAARKAAAA